RREALGEHRARGGDFVRELGERPVMGRPLVDLRQRRANERVTETGEPTRMLFWERPEVLPHDLDEHQLGHAREHRVASSVQIARLTHCLLPECGKPTAVAMRNME